MMQNQPKKPIKQIAKLCFWASIGLACVAAIEAGQDRVRAIDAMPTPAASPVVQAPPPELAIPELSSIEKSPQTPAKSLQPERSVQSSNSANKPQRQKLAINAGAADNQVAQLTATQVAANTWTGASFPVENFQAYTSPFGYRSSPDGGYSQEFHYGLDMASPEGSYIRNWWTGKVVEVSDDSNCGTSVVIESGPWLHIYCHMQGHVETEDGKRYMIDRSGGIQIWEGQQMPAGSRIGRVGMTGRTTGPHLHWGLKYNENWVDPALVLRAMYFNQSQTVVNSNRGSVQ